jgi:deferrochelatase/peroxidase EfeB
LPPITSLTRRRLLASAGVGAAAVGLGGGGLLAGRQLADASGDGTGSVPFYGEHQAGIDTAAQDRLHFAAFDLLGEDPAELRELMRAWTEAAAEASAGEMVGDVNEAPLAPPDDTGETVGLLPSRLTVTFGFGPSLFDKPGLGLAAKRPAALEPLPPLPGDELNPAEAAVTSASRPAPTIPRSPSTPSATWPGSAAARWRCAGPSSASAAPRRPAAARTRRAT